MMKRIFLVLISVFAMAQWAFAAVDINSADVQALATVKSIGPKKAKAIVDYRTQNGPFKTVDDLTNVKGIKAKTLAKIRPELTVGGTSTNNSMVSTATSAAKDSAKTMVNDAKKQATEKASNKAVDVLKGAAGIK